MKESLIVVYGDSMCLPNVKARVGISEVYPELLADYQTARGTKARVYSRGEGGRTINDHWTRYVDDRHAFSLKADDLLIIHAGMVDCAPRPLPQKWRRRLERQPAFIRQPIVSFIKNNRAWMLNRGFIFYKVDPPTFKKRIELWLDDAIKQCGQIVVVAIPPIRQSAEDLSPGWRKNIVLYNRIMADAVARHAKGVHFIPVYEALSEDKAKYDACVSSVDGYHFTTAGHILVRDLIVAALDAGKSERISP